MAHPYRLVTSRARIPVPGGKLIEELFGRVNTGTDGFSLAHMVAPPGWSEPAQTPAFGELTLMIRGRMRVEIAGEAVDLSAGQALWSWPGLRVRSSPRWSRWCSPGRCPLTSTGRTSSCSWWGSR